MEQNYYKQYFDFERTHWWFLARAEILRSYIQNLKFEKGIKILNVGAATGATSQWLQENGEVTSLEHEKNCIDFVKQKIDLDFVHGSVLNMPFQDKSFDLVCCFDVIEHVQDEKLAINELKRVCKKGGTILVTVPAFMHLWSLHDEINHHFRRYQLEDMKNLFGNNKGEIRFASYFNSKLYPLIYIIRKISTFFDKLFKKNPKSDFEGFKFSVTNKIFYKILSSEKVSLANGKTFPKGVSIILDWKKLE